MSAPIRVYLIFFGFLHEVDKCSIDELRTAANNLVNIYSADIEDSLNNELIQFIELVKLVRDREDVKEGSIERSMYTLLVNKNLKSTFPNVDIILRIYLCMMVSNCSGERAFSKLKILKNRLRTTMNQEKSNWLSLMSIEKRCLAKHRLS